MDSAALLPFYLSRGAEVRGVHFDYGQPTLVGERRSVLALSRHYDITVDAACLGFAVECTEGEYHYRNALLVLAAASIAQHAHLGIAIGIHAGPPYYDCTPAFVDDMQRVLDGYRGGSTRVEAPFLEFSKRDIFDFCLGNDVPVDLTFSCERGSNRACQQCASCEDRMALSEGR
jgi:7-cyano-7-deazaguanine synthase